MATTDDMEKFMGMFVKAMATLTEKEKADK
jgi:hypothetical protein